MLTAEDIEQTEIGAEQVASNPECVRTYKSVLVGEGGNISKE